MKTIILLLLLSLPCYGQVGRTTYTDFTKDSSCVAYYSFNNDQHDTAIDEGSNGNNLHGVLTSSPTITTGKEGLGYDFNNGDADYLLIPDNDGLTGSALTALCWVNSDDVSTIQQAIFYKYSSSTNQRSWAFGTNTATKARLQFTISSTAASFNGAQVTTDNNVLIVNTWHHVGFVFNGGATSLDIYVDGVSVPYSFDTGSIPASAANNTELLRIGESGTGIGSQAFDGTIDEIAIFDRVLTQAEIKEIYTYGLK